MRNKHSHVSDPNFFSSHPGNTHRVIFSPRFDSDGTINLVESGRVDIKAEINSHAAETDMAVIIDKLQRGDTSVLTSKKAMYGDFTKFPSTFAEAYDLVNRSESAFESLPVDIKQQFDNDRAKWFASIGTPEWYEIMGIFGPGLAPVEPALSEKEVVE